MSHEIRSAGIRAGRRKGEFTARAVRYNTRDDYGSVWSPGAFTESLNRRLPVIAWGHDWTDAIGRATSWRDTADGPEITARLDVSPDVPRARQALAQLESGTIDSVSVGFTNTKRREPTDEELKRWPGAVEVIISADLDELSLVLRGAVPGAEVLSVRSRIDDELRAGRITPAQASTWRELDETLRRLRSRPPRYPETMSPEEARRRIRQHADRHSPPTVRLSDPEIEQQIRSAADRSPLDMFKSSGRRGGR